MKLLTRVAVIAAVSVIVAGALLFLPILGDPLFSVKDLLYQRQEQFSSQEILEQIVDVYELHTVEYVYRMVFPHDFYREGISLRGIFDRLADAQGAPEVVLTPEELAYLRAYNLAFETGLPTSPEGDSFVVVTARVRGGYSATVAREMEELFRLEAAEEAASDAGEPSPDGNGLAPEESRVVVLLPEARIVELIIEDLNRENYPYPAARVDAEEWREISSFVAEEAGRRTIEEGILQEAEENARSFLTALLSEAGFAQIEFASPEGRK